ncbi:MAG: Gas vesicle synthesis protein GvpL/GvpF [Solirubrobacterales bacterium]|nr:Gas vesicle synthesis protein GvpL/GvpF [Solirubrobacterales bacterium]
MPVPAGGHYLYGFVRSGDLPAKLGEGGVGLPPGPVECLAEGGVAALVTPLGPERVAPRRANLLAHADVLNRAFERATVLPLRFGFVLPDEAAVRHEIASRAGELAGLLDALQDRVEMHLSALYREERLLGEVLAENPAIAAAQRRLRGLPVAATHFERIRLGERVAQAVDAKRAADGAAVVRELERLSAAVAPEDPRHEHMVVNASFLVARDRLDEFDAAVERVSRERAERMHFRLLGPRPPHSFVDAARPLAGAR